MKKIDLHIHTRKTISDRDFRFDLSKLQRYVGEQAIDCIAITNHNLFDIDQFNTINDSLSISVFPGIEIDLEGGHLLLISANDELLDFSTKCKKVTDCIVTKEDSLSLELFLEIFYDLDKYILIPHHDKKPKIKSDLIERIPTPIYCGEVSSVRKFKMCLADSASPVPVIFSDERISDDLTNFSTKQTYVRIDAITFKGLKSCLSDKNKVFLTNRDNGNEYFQANEHGLILSTGLNVVLGERSSGKTFTLESINEAHDNIKYIEQFSLLQNDEEKFERLLSIRESSVTENYLKDFKNILSEISEIDIKKNVIGIEKYLQSLLKFAAESERADSFASAVLFGETLYTEDSIDNLNDLILSTRTLIRNTEYKNIIDKHINRKDLLNLSIELIEEYRSRHETNLKKRWLNELINNIQDELRFRTTTTYIEDADFYQYLIENEKVHKFNLVVNLLRKERLISCKNIRDFKIVAYTRKFTGAQQLKNKSRRRVSFIEAFECYDDPYEYLQCLKDMDIEDTEHYKYFVDFVYKTLNKDGNEVSGGERSEFNLLHEINDALKHDLLLIDEPESSFDNIFLRSQVNQLIKDISREIPVVIVTHNNTVGASIKPDFLVYTTKEYVDGETIFKVFSGSPYSKQLFSNSGETIDNYNMMINCLEAGKEAYLDRRTNAYEILED